MPSARGLFSARAELAASLIAGTLLLLGFLLTRAAGQDWARSLYWVSLAIGMLYGGRAAIAALRARKFDIDVLMVVGAALAAWLNAPAEGALLLFLFVLSGALEALAMQRTTRAVEALHRLMPTAALKWEPVAGPTPDNGQPAASGDGEGGRWVHVEPESLVPGDRIKILPGESLPTDAKVTLGVSSINQANLTGESMPREVGPGDDLYAGTINVGNPIEARVTRPVRESSLQRILNLVMEAQQQREPIQRLIDRVSQPYALTVLAASILVLLVWCLVFNVPLKDATYTAITLLIVMSPCALIISTPTATLAAIARGARAGVLFKGGQSIERLSRMTAVAFDKTGTLTIGRPRVQQVHPVGWSSAERMLAVAAGLEQDSTHPIAAAIRDAAAQRAIAPAPLERPTFTPGRGVSGEFNGHPARLGTLAFVEELIPACLRSRVAEVLGKVQLRGQIGTAVSCCQEAGVIILSDEIRPGAPELVQRLHDLGVRPVCMLTGDNCATAQHVAQALGIDEWHAEMLPGDKVEAVKELKRRVASGPGRRRPGAVGVIGDGVNDAPALAAADVSIAIGSIGSDAALESADIVLLSDDLSVVPWATALARRARFTIAVNLAFSLGAIAIMALATLVGSRLGFRLPLWAGVLGHEGGTLLVVANSLLLLTFASPQLATVPTRPADGGRKPVAVSPAQEQPVQAAAGT